MSMHLTEFWCGACPHINTSPGLPVITIGAKLQSSKLVRLGIHGNCRLSLKMGSSLRLAALNMLVNAAEPRPNSAY